MENTAEHSPNRPSLLKRLGPGLITGASDDDPSGIGTYSQAGAMFGYGMLWTLVFSYPLMVAIQRIAGQLAWASGLGLSANIRQHLSYRAGAVLVAVLLGANVINLGADLAAMAAGMQLVAGGPAIAYAIGLGVCSMLAQIYIPYRRYVKVLKWLTLVLFAYVGVVLTVKLPWDEILHQLVRPQFPWNNDALMMIVAVFGTTISPYMFYWQAAQEIEEEQCDEASAQPAASPAPDEDDLKRIADDTAIGMGFSNLIAFAIMLATAATLHAHGVDKIDTAAQAAQALKPVAGAAAFTLFALGIVGSGLLALPVLAGSAAYAVAELQGWPKGLEKRPARARGFYGVIAAMTLGGVLLNLTPINPVKALYWSAVLNGIAAVPIMGVMVWMASRRDITQGRVASPALRWLGWATVLVMGLAACAMIASWFRG